MGDTPKKIVLLNPLHPRMLLLVRYFDSVGGEEQIDLTSLSEKLGIPRQAILRFTRWLELYGAIHVNRTSLGFGEGRAVNTYRLLMPAADYERDAMHIREVVRKALKPKVDRKGGRVRFPRHIPVVSVSDMDAIRAQAREEVALALKGDPLPRLEQEPLGYEDVEAWGAFNG